MDEPQREDRAVAPLTGTPLGRVIGSPLASALLLGLFIAAGVAALRMTGSLQGLELAAYDWNMRLRPSATDSPPAIALVTITEADIRKQGAWPLSDETLARALERLIEHDPRAIGLDIYRDVPVPPGRGKLNAVLASHPNIVVMMKFEDGSETGVPPPPVLASTDQVGFNDVPVDSEGTVRRGLLFLDDGNNVAYSFALRLALLYLKGEDIVLRPDPSNPEHMRLGTTTIPPFEANDGSYVAADARGYQFLLDFRDPLDAVSVYSLDEVLGDRVESGAFQDKIVLIGVSAESVKDFFFIPSRGLISGIELHAAMLNQLLRMALTGAPPTRTLSDSIETVSIFICSLLGGLLGLRARSASQLALLFGGLAGAITGIGYVSFVRDWWLPIVAPLAAGSLSMAAVTAYVAQREQRQRQLIMNLFSRHVSPEIAQAIWQQRDQFLQGGRPRPQKMTATVLFTDLQNYTAVAEKLEPQAFMDWLNEYMAAMTPLVAAHGGVIIRFFGDAIMAVFGVPLPRSSEAEIEKDAANAVRCVLAMERRLAELNRRWSREGRASVGMRAGIFTGPVVTGSLGDGHRLEYNVQGDTVNTAQRLEGFDKERFAPDPATGWCRTLLGETTRGCIGEQFRTERVGELKLKGKANVVTVFRLLGARTDHTVPASPRTSRP